MPDATTRQERRLRRRESLQVKKEEAPEIPDEEDPQEQDMTSSNPVGVPFPESESSDEDNVEEMRSRGYYLERHKPERQLEACPQVVTPSIFSGWKEEPIVVGENKQEHQPTGEYREPTLYGHRSHSSLHRIQQRLLRENLMGLPLSSFGGEPASRQPVRPAMSLGDVPIPAHLELVSGGTRSSSLSSGTLFKLLVEYSIFKDVFTSMPIFEIDKSPAGAEYAKLEMTLSTLALTNHSRFFCAEDLAFAKMRVMYGDYGRRLDQQRVVFHASRFLKLSQELARSNSTDLVNEFGLLVDELRELNALFVELYQHWIDIQTCRRNQGWSNTSAHVTLQAQASRDAIDLSAIDKVIHQPSFVSSSACPLKLKNLIQMVSASFSNCMWFIH